MRGKYLSLIPIWRIKEIMKSDKKEIGRLIAGMKSAYARNENVMAWARDNSAGTDNTIVSSLIAYDLQAGTYVEKTQANPEYVNTWSTQLAELFRITRKSVAIVEPCYELATKKSQQRMSDHGYI